MKRTFTKALALLLCLAFAGTLLAGCGKKEKYFVIGGTGPLTGGAAQYGIAAQNGAKIAIEEINEAGGLNGIKFKLEMINDEAASEKVSGAYDTLVKAGMHASIGSVTSGAAMEMAKLTKADNVFFMTPSASADDVIKEDNAYRICFGDSEQGKIVGETICDTYKKIGIIYDESSDYSLGLVKAVEDVAKTDSTITVTKQAFGGDNKNFAAQVSAIKAAQCDVLFLPMYYAEAALIIKEAVTQSLDVPFFGADGFDGLVKHVSGDSELSAVMNKVSYVSHFDPYSNDEKVKAFVDKYKELYDEVPMLPQADMTPFGLFITRKELKTSI